MQGTRLPDAEMGVPGPGWKAWGSQPDGCGELSAPLGAYMKVASGTISVWYVRDPLGDICTIANNHQVIEHDDGTISVRPSIVNPNGSYHGFLQRGFWSKV